MKNKNVAVFIRTTNIYDDSRATKEIYSLVDAGFKVIVLGWGRREDASLKCAEAFKDVKNEVSFSFYSVLLPTGIGMRNIDKLFGWFQWVKRKVKCMDQISLIHACNLDGGICVYRFCKRNRIPFIYDIYDYYVDAHHIPNIAKTIVEKMEINVINNANTTIICTEERRVQIGKATPKKIEVIYNSPDIDNLNDVEIKSDYAYCGSLCEKRLIKEILDEYINNTDLVINFAGNDSYYEYVKKISNDYANFNFLGTLPYSEVLKIESEARVISAIYEPSIRNHKLCAPNKFYEALALGKPIIVCRGTGLDKIVENEKIGIVIAYDAKQFYTALRTLLSDKSMCEKMGLRARKIYEEKYRWSLMKKRLEKIYNEFIKREE